MKVLVATPTYSGMEYCRKKFIRSLKDIDYPEFDIMVVDNSKDSKYYSKIKNIPGIIVVRDLTEEKDNLKRLISSRNKILDYAKKNHYDFLLMMDSDVVVPPNILTELLKQKKDIISGLYFRYFEREGKKFIEAVSYRELTQNEKEIYKEEIAKTGEKSSEIIKPLDEEDLKKNIPIKVRICSPGCMLLSKKAFSKLNYGLLDYGADDNYFFEMARKKNFDVFCLPSVKCVHILSKSKDKLEAQ